MEPQPRARIASEAPVSLIPLTLEIPSSKYFESCFLAVNIAFVKPARAETPVTVPRNTAATDITII